MPRLKECSSLRSVCLKVFADWLLKTSREFEERGDNAEEILQYMTKVHPAYLSQLLATYIPETFLSSYKDCDNCRQCGLYTAVRSCLTPSLKHVNLKNVVNCGFLIRERVSIHLHHILTKMKDLRYLNISLANCHGDIRYIKKMMRIIGETCSELQSLDISCIPSVDSDCLPLVHSCSKLESVFIFKCNIKPEDVAVLLRHIPALGYVGYTFLGRALQMVGYPIIFKNLKYLDNTGGSHYHKLNVAKDVTETLVQTIAQSCPGVTHLKVRLHDNEATKLLKLTNITSLELCFNTGTPSYPGGGTAKLLKLMGSRLTCLTIVCGTMFRSQLGIIGQFCPNLLQFWLKCNDIEGEGVLANPGHHFEGLKKLFLQIGRYPSDEISVTVEDMQYFLCYCFNVVSLSIMITSELLTDDMIMHMLQINSLKSCEEVIFDIPLSHARPGRLSLTILAATELMESLNNLRVLANLAVWTLSSRDSNILAQRVRTENLDLTLEGISLYDTNFGIK